jgi:hypothetical protein
MTNAAIDVEVMNDEENGQMTRSVNHRQQPPEEAHIPFRTWINEEIARDTPDFQMVGILSPVLGRRFTSKELEVVKIADMNFPQVKGLTAAEQNFSEWMETKIQNNQSRVAVYIVGLARKLRAYDETCHHESFSYSALVDHPKKAYLKGDKLIATIVSNPEYEGITSSIWRKKGEVLNVEIACGEQVEEIGERVETPPMSIAASKELIYTLLNNRGGDCYDIFVDQEGDSIQEIMKIANTTTSEGNQNILRATFMIAHRIDPGWSVGDTFQLLATEIEAIMKHWAKEKNGGVEPKPPTEDEPPAKSEADEKTEEAELAMAGAEKKDSTSPG